MKILSITTSSPVCGVAILENEEIIKEINLENGLTHSETLMPIIKSTLEEANISLKDIDLLVVDRGPGSFTGIRIGIATAKAFADALNIKTIGVNSLEGLAMNVESEGIICSLIDAKRENVFNEIVENKNGALITKREPSFDNIDILLEEIQSKYNGLTITFVGDGALNYKDKILTKLPSSLFLKNNTLNAKNIAILGAKYIDNDDYFNIEPLYLRKSEAEQKCENNV